MRDILVTLLVFGSLPFILRRPYIGVLVWSWLSYMNPHRLTWGFAYSMPFAQIVAITLFISMLTTKEKISIPWNATIYVWIIFLFWTCITTFFAIYPDAASLQLIKVIKIQVITFVTLMLITDQKKINQLVWVIVLSIGFFGVKGGFFTLVTGGSYRVYGPMGSYIAENNGLAVAILMTFPLMFYIYKISRETIWLRCGMLLAMALSLVSVFGSQSRGALIAVLAVAVFFWLKTRAKLLSAMAFILFGITIFMFMPESWHARMDTIENYQEDRSAQGRINAWRYSFNVANDRLTGAGFESWEYETFAIWAPDPEKVHAAHSIYFSVLADHGWPGLVLFVLILFMTWRHLSRVVKMTDSQHDSADYNLLARVLQVSMIAYMSGGAFLSLSYFDLPWHIVALAILLDKQVTTTNLAVSGTISGRQTRGFSRVEKI